MEDLLTVSLDPCKNPQFVNLESRLHFQTLAVPLECEPPLRVPMAPFAAMADVRSGQCVLCQTLSSSSKKCVGVISNRKCCTLQSPTNFLLTKGQGCEKRSKSYNYSTLFESRPRDATSNQCKRPLCLGNQRGVLDSFFMTSANLSTGNRTCTLQSIS